MSDRDALHLAEMLQAAEQIAFFINELDETAFTADHLRVDAVSMNMIVIGEGASQLSPGLRAQHPEIAWDDIRGLRHRIAHAYKSVDQRVVWKIVTASLPILRSQLKQLMAPN